MGYSTSTHNTQDLLELMFILGLNRPHNGEGVFKLIDYIESKYDVKRQHCPKGELLALTITVGNQCRSLFTAHLDSVHKHDGDNMIIYDMVTNLIRSGDDTPLGADDGAGVWLLLRMIDAGVIGVYQLTMGEECGGIGSKGVAQYHADWLKNFDRAIAFDRKGTHSVITHQGFGRCCSDEFAEELASRLTNDDYFFAPDDTGIYTDTAEYVELIPECTNISCGYYNEHTAKETLDVTFLFALRETVLSIEWDTLPVERDPAAIEIDYEYSFHDSYNSKCLIYDDETTLTTDGLQKLTWYELVELVGYADPLDIAGVLKDLLDERSNGQYNT